jgi:type II secretory pathway pseudopilin PulG
MKTKRRQELKSNDLAAWLEDVSKSASQWGGWVLGGLAVIIIVVFISRYRTNARLEARSEAFSALRTASSMQVGSMTKTPEEIRTSLATIDDLIAETPDNDFKIEALLGKADLAMSLARRALGGDETAKVDDPQAVLDDARAAYERVISKYQDRVVYHGRALYGLFQVETLGFVADQDPARRATAEGYLTKIRDNPAFQQHPAANRGHRHAQRPGPGLYRGRVPQAASSDPRAQCGR